MINLLFLFVCPHFPFNSLRVDRATFLQNKYIFLQINQQICVKI